MGQKLVDKLKRRYQISIVSSAVGVADAVYVASYTSVKRIITQIRENSHVLEFVDVASNDVFIYTHGLVAITVNELEEE